MSPRRNAAVFVAVILAVLGCSRRDDGVAKDSTRTSVDTISSTKPARAGSPPAGEASRRSSETARPGSPARNYPPSGSQALPAKAEGTRSHLVKLTPSSGSLGTGEIITVEVIGDRLTGSGNTIFFGAMNLGEAAASNGRTLRFAIPQTIPSRGEVPPMAIQGGRYGVYVVNANGTSDTLFFTLKGPED